MKKIKHILSIYDLTSKEIWNIIQSAIKLKKQKKSKFQLKGKVAYKNDSFGIVHCSVGKASFEKDKLVENIKTLVSAVLKAKPSAAKGQYVKSISVSSTMGPGIYIDQNAKM